MQGNSNNRYTEKKYFLLRLIAPRPTFAIDMTPEEMQVMQAHGAYLKKYVEEGTVIVMGPVLDPKGSWGVAIMEVESEKEVQSIIAQDPTILSGLGFRYEVLPMFRAIVRK